MASMSKLNLCGEEVGVTSADGLSSLLYVISTLTEPPAPAVTVSVLGMGSKLATTVASSVTEPAVSTQVGLVVVIDSQASPDGPDSVQRAMR